MIQLIIMLRFPCDRSLQPVLQPLLVPLIARKRLQHSLELLKQLQQSIVLQRALCHRQLDQLVRRAESLRFRKTQRSLHSREHLWKE